MKRCAVTVLLLALAVCAAGCGQRAGKADASSNPLTARVAWESPAAPGDSWGLCALSPEGDRVVCADKEGFWLVTPEGAEAILSGPDVRSIDWQPGGNEIAFIDAKKMPVLCLLDVTTHKVRRSDSWSWATAMDLKWSHSGRRIACAEDRRGTDEFWAVVTASYPDLKEELIPLPTESSVRAVPIAWSPDDTEIIAATATDTGWIRRYKLIYPVWVVNLRKRSARRVWKGNEDTHILAVGFEADSGKPCYITQEWTSDGPDKPLLLRVGSGRVVATLRARRGRVLSSPMLFPDGKGMIAISANVADLYDIEPPLSSDGENAGENAAPEAVPIEAVQADLVWTYQGKEGRIALPSGYMGKIFGWSRDGRRVGVLCSNGAERKVVVYEFK